MSGSWGERRPWCSSDLSCFSIRCEIPLGYKPDKEYTEILGVDMATVQWIDTALRLEQSSLKVQMERWHPGACGFMDPTRFWRFNLTLPRPDLKGSLI